MGMQATAEIAERISTISVSSTLKVSADADRLRREGVDVVDFGAGEPDFPTPENIKQAAVEAIAANFTKYTNAGGTPELREAICYRHRADFGTSYTPSECMVTVGGKHAIFNLIQALVNPGDEVIIPVPYWVTYKDVVNYAGGRCVFVPTDETKGFEVTAAAIDRHITNKTKLLIINSPNNPSGSVLPRDEFRKIFALTSKRDIFLMTDECYCKFVYDGEPYSIAAEPGAKDTVVVAGSLSKTYAMTGWRIGFALAPAPIIGAMMKLQSQHLKPDLYRAKSGSGGHARAARFCAGDVGRISTPPRFRRQEIAGDSGRHDCHAGRRLLCLSEHQHCFSQWPREELARFLERVAFKSSRGCCTGRSVRNQRSRPNLVRHFHGRAGTRAGPAASFYGRAALSEN